MIFNRKHIRFLDELIVHKIFKTTLLFQNIILSLEDRDAEELILVLCGYYRLLTDRELEIIQEKSRWSEEQGKFFEFEISFQLIFYMRNTILDFRNINSFVSLNFLCYT